MWHEARKQERKIRGMIVDFKRRAERRQDFYEKIKADPTQFMQIHGRKCLIHLDPAVAAAGDATNIIVPWQGQEDNLIDRFDVRAHLDFILPAPKSKENEEQISQEERQCNYERYRILAQNDFLGISEDKYLHQLFLEEQYGASVHQEPNLNNLNNKKKNPGAAIGYTYEDSEASAPFNHAGPQIIQSTVEDDSEDSNSDIDMDVSIEISKLDTNQAHELNGCGRNYGMISNDYYSYLNADFDEADALRMAKEEEHEKMMLSGRKSRRERRAQRERRFAGRPLSPPSYAAKEDPVVESKENESGNSRSPSPENTGKITYITSFGGEDDLQPHSKISINMHKQLGKDGQPVTYADKVKENLGKLKRINEEQSRRFCGSDSPKKPKQYLRSRSRSIYKRRSRSRDRRRRSRSRDYRRGNSRRFCRKRSRSRSITYDRYRRSRSRSYRPRRYTKSPIRLRSRRYSTSSSSSSSFASRKSSRYSENKKLCSKKVPEKLPDLAKRLLTNQNKISLNTQLEKESERFENIIKNLQYQLVQPPPPPPPPKEIKIELEIKEESPPNKRYYGRKRENQSSSSESDDSSDKRDNENSNSDRSNAVTIKTSNPLNNALTSGLTNNSSNLSNFGKTLTTSIDTTKIGVSSAGSSKTLRERLKRKMQILLNKQYKADKQAEIERTERQIQQQEEREYEMRELALRLRRRNRELRHKYGSPSQSSSDGNAERKAEEAIKEILGEKKKSRSNSRSKERNKRPLREPISIRADRYRRRSPSNYDRRKRSTSADYRRGRRSSSRRNNRRRISVSKSRSPSYNRRRRSRSKSRHRLDDKKQRSRNSDSRYRYSRSSSRGKHKNEPKIKTLKKLVDY